MAGRRLEAYRKETYRTGLRALSQWKRFNPFRVGISSSSHFPGFAPRADLCHPCGVEFRALLLSLDQRNIERHVAGIGRGDAESVEQNSRGFAPRADLCHPCGVEFLALLLSLDQRNIERHVAGIGGGDAESVE